MRAFNICAARQTSGQLILKRASALLPSGEWNDDHYDVLAERRRGRSDHERGGSVGASWLWTYGFDPRERKPAHGYCATREAAMAAFASSWRREISRAPNASYTV
jgi:hypothetical protein